ncbi:carboxylate-amine ligase [Dictyobacter kobayashii]|uniref:Putative glutamate--cysteine ligase 2 n=1 Tax=Dictyobacter kobayashii TaxID=2014872 RepID=A0A402AUS1_9CHLR|nr:glutamate--cysteine ligase [Dictyobacter kobayashii]GCE22799.1 putative glutamate--cysteine ligase 2 [Dictyobacter kobayashii]
MSSDPKSWSIGIEEEYQIIDPHTRALTSASQSILSFIEPDLQQHIDSELQSSQIETASPICYTLSEVRNMVIHMRAGLISAAAKANCWIAAAATHPFSHWNEQQITQKPRYQQVQQNYQQLSHEQVIQGCHVHIGCPDRELALQIINRARLWLAPLLALSANSPYWLKADTGYASFRSIIWSRWPIAGPPPYIPTSAAYNDLIRLFIRTGTLEDASHVYWDIRLSEHYPTIEFRIMDVCMTVDETVMLTGLIRALVQTCAEQARQGIPYPTVPNEVLRAAHWRAARYGLEQDLTDADAGSIIPAHELIERFLLLLRPVLKENNEWAEISTLVNATLRHGNGAMRQRTAFKNTERHQDVVDFIVAETARGVAQHPLVAELQHKVAQH